MASKEKFNINKAFISEYEKEQNLWNIQTIKYKNRNTKKASSERLGEKFKLLG